MEINSPNSIETKGPGNGQRPIVKTRLDNSSIYGQHGIELYNSIVTKSNYNLCIILIIKFIDKFNSITESHFITSL